MLRRAPAFIVLLLVAPALAGCLGGDPLSVAPQAEVIVEPVPGQPDTFRFDASGSKGRDLSFAWDLSGTETATGAIVEHHYAWGSGVYTVRLIITDADGVKDLWTGEVVVGDGQNAPPEALFGVEKRFYRTGEAVRVDARQSSDPDGDPLVYHWDFNHLIQLHEYEDFRAAKSGIGAAAADGSGDSGGDGGDASATTAVNPGSGSGTAATGLLAALRQMVGEALGAKHDDHGTDSISPSFFVHTAVTEDPVYVLEGGFPDATTYFIRLRAYDVKGAHEAIRSEEIWAVEVAGEPPGRFQSGNTSGVLTFGAPAAITDVLPTGESYDDLYRFERAWDFELDWPLRELYVNLTYDAGPEDPTGSLPVQNRVRLEVTSPANDSKQSDEPGGFHSFHWSHLDEPGIGKWRVYLIARQGVQIEYELKYWSERELNPFWALEGRG